MPAICARENRVNGEKAAQEDSPSEEEEVLGERNGSDGLPESPSAAVRVALRRGEAGDERGKRHVAAAEKTGIGSVSVAGQWLSSC